MTTINGFNYDFLGNYAASLPPVVGLDLSGGGGPIESWYEDAFGRKIYPTPRTRLQYFTEAEKQWFSNKLTFDIGDHFVSIQPDSNRDTTADPQKRKAYYVSLKFSPDEEAFDIPLARVASMLWAGFDANEVALYDQKEYILGVNESYANPGKYSWDDRRGLMYTPQRRVV